MMPSMGVILISFLSTLSLRRATSKLQRSIDTISISIHALLAESDYDASVLMKCQVKFLSTLSLRRATRRSVKLFRQNFISIHALLAESDSSTPAVRSKFIHFYPRSPCGERRIACLIEIIC